MDTPIDNNDYTWSTRVDESGRLEVLLDGEHVTTLRVWKDYRPDDELLLVAKKTMTKLVKRGRKSNAREVVWVRTYGHGQH